MNKKKWWLLITLLLPAVVLAQVNVHDQASAAYVVNKTDLSMSYLGMIFGRVGDVLSSSTGSILPTLIGAFNMGVVIAASMILVYGIVMMVFRASTEATFMAANRNTYMIVARVAVGFALLLPLSSASGAFSGYNSLQIILMKVVKYGVMLADNTWDKALDTYVKQDGKVLQSSAMADSSGSSGVLDPAFVEGLLMNNSQYDDTSNSLASKIGSYIKTTANIKYINSISLMNSGSFIQKLFVLQSCMTANQLSSGKNLYPEVDGNKVVFPSGRADNPCGSVDLTALRSKMSKTFSIQDLGGFVIGMANALVDGAKQYVCNNWNKGPEAAYSSPLPSSCGAIITQKKNYTKTNDTVNPMLNTMSNDFYTCFLLYVKKARLTMNSAQTNTKRLAFDFITEAKSDGWITAGSFYWNLVNNHNASTGTFTYAKTVSQKMIKVHKSGGPVFPYLDLSISSSKDIPKASLVAYYKVRNSIATGQKGKTGEVTTVGAGLEELSGLVGIIFGPVAQVLVDLVRIFARFASFRIGHDPIIWLTGLGGLFINLSASMFFSFVIATALTLLPFIAGRLFIDPLKVMTEAYNWLRPVVITACGIYFMAGVTLEFMVPMYPFIVFTFGVISWFTLLIEAMIAMPLVAMGITHPEGHDFLGRAEQAVMMLLSVFLRPVLMIIGLISGIILSHVALQFVIFAFSTFIIDLFNPGTNRSLLDPHLDPLLSSTTAAWGWLMLNTGSIGSFILRFFIAVPLLFYIFQDMVYQVVKACYNMVFILPDFIMRWIGGPQQTGGAVSSARIAEAIKQATVGREGAITQMKGSAEELASNYLKDKPPTDRSFKGKVNDPSKDDSEGEDTADENKSSVLSRLKSFGKSVWNSRVNLKKHLETNDTFFGGSVPETPIAYDDDSGGSGDNKKANKNSDGKSSGSSKGNTGSTNSFWGNQSTDTSNDDAGSQGQQKPPTFFTKMKNLFSSIGSSMKKKTGNVKSSAQDEKNRELGTIAPDKKDQDKKGSGKDE